MQAISKKAHIKEMTPEELQLRADELYSMHNGELLSLTPDEHDELKCIAAEYYHQTGEALQPSFTATHPIF